MEIKNIQKTELFYIIDHIAHMEDDGYRYKAMYVIWDIAQRIKRNELTTSMNQSDVFTDYGIIIEDGKIADWGNTDVDTWKNKLLNDFNIRCSEMSRSKY